MLTGVAIPPANSTGALQSKQQAQVQQVDECARQASCLESELLSMRTSTKSCVTLVGSQTNGSTLRDLGQSGVIAILGRFPSKI
jgi:hypothetical protein